MSDKELIKEYVKSILKEEWWLEAYDKDILSDPAFEKQSVFVPDDIKKQLKKYFVKMGLSSSPKKKRKADSYSEEKP